MVVGQTTKREILERLGPPDRILRQYDGDVFVYAYIRRNATTITIEEPVITNLMLFSYQKTQEKSDRLVVFFDRAGFLSGLGYRRGTLPARALLGARHSFQSSISRKRSKAEIRPTTGAPLISSSVNRRCTSSSGVAGPTLTIPVSRTSRAFGIMLRSSHRIDRQGACRRRHGPCESGVPMAADDARVEPLEPGLVAFLATPEAYPDDPSAKRGVQHIQTHLSHVYLTAERVYKLHKAVRFGFVDFATRAERSADSLRELHLNRRLARDVYLGVAPVDRRDGALRLGALGERLRARLRTERRRRSTSW